ncbi:MAG TPA: PIN domain-containing protein [Duganella sp.]|uniref:PIN domain-containing protein n=1 Tax=Duganella sp. TaxID=1904440 RepID=UPI002ED20249
MAIVLFDTNIFIDHFNQHHEATEELLNYVDSVISSITWIEVACRFSEPDKREFAHLLLASGIRVVHISDEIMFRAASIRGESIVNKPKISLPDCIIRATAEVEGRVIITRNPKDYGGEGPMIRVPYKLENGVVSDVKPRLQ